MKKAIFLLIAVIILTGCEDQKEKAEVLTGEAFGTTYQVKYFTDTSLDSEKALDSIFEVINQSMSTYRETSDISRINRGEENVQVDENFKEVFNYSRQIHEESDGYFDPTVGNLVNAYGFGPEEQLKEPDSVLLDSLTRLVGFEKVNFQNNIIIKEQPEIYLDFNAIAKGYAIDIIGKYLENRNVENFLIELGGELLAKGENLDKNAPWIVAIDDPGQTNAKRTFQTVLALENRGMATSGNYRKFRTDSLGKSYVHTINPKTGKAEKSNLLSASVLAKNCTLADGYATAFMALGYEKSLEILPRLEDVDVYFIYAEEGEEFGIYASEGFKEALRE